MSSKTVFCIANCRNLAELIVDQLKFYNLSNKDISILYPDEERNSRKTHHFGYDVNRGNTDGAWVGAGLGGLVGGALDWIMGIGALTVPGAGAFIAAGPIIASLNRDTAGGIAGGLIGMGIPEPQARHYEGRIRLGNFLISVHTESPAEAMQAKFIFTRARAQDICHTDVAFFPQGPGSAERPPQRPVLAYNAFLPDSFPAPGLLDRGALNLS